MGKGLSKKRETRLLFLNRQSIYFDDLDNKFYKLNRDTPLDGFFKKYILKNKKQFYFEGEIEISDFDPAKLAKELFAEQNIRNQ